MTIKEKTWCVIWSYDDFKYNYEECEKEYDNPIDAMKDAIQQKKDNRDYMISLGEPKMAVRIRRKEEFIEEPNVIYITDFHIRKYKNRYFLRRAEDII